MVAFKKRNSNKFFPANNNKVEIGEYIFKGKAFELRK